MVNIILYIKIKDIVPNKFKKTNNKTMRTNKQVDQGHRKSTVILHTSSNHSKTKLKI